MADDDLGKLEPPSLGFGFRRRKKAAVPPEPVVEEAADETTGPVRPIDSTDSATAPETAAAVDTPADEPVDQPVDQPADEVTQVIPFPASDAPDDEPHLVELGETPEETEAAAAAVPRPAEDDVPADGHAADETDEAAETPADEPTTIVAVIPPAAEGSAEDHDEDPTEIIAATPRDTTDDQPHLVELGETPDETDRTEVIATPEPMTAPPLFADEQPALPPEPDPEPTPVTRPATIHAPAAPAVEPDQPVAAREARIPALSGPVAAAAAGLLVGAFIVAATLASQRLCTVVRGTSSCGTPGYLLLSAILVLGIVLGSWLLAFAGAEEPGSTSFLAVALLAVLALIFFGGLLLSWWMILAAPVLSIVCFSLSHWVTTRLAAEPLDA